MRKIAGLCSAFALVVVAASCGGGGSAAGPPPPPPPPPPPSCPANTFCATTSNKFSPTTLTVPTGTTVTWQNDTGVTHNVVWDDANGQNAAAAGDGTGNIGSFSTGSHTRMMTTAGTFGFHCTIHPGMNGSLTVQ